VTEAAPHTRLRACAQVVVAVFYYFLARSVAHHGAIGLAGDNWSPLVEQAMLVFLLVFGYAAMGFWFQRQLHPIGRQGLPRRAGFGGEFALGLATGWAIAVVCVIPMAMAGGIAVLLSGRISEWGWFAADALFFLLATLAEEIAFRGYGFQRFVEAAGPLGGALGFSAYYALVQQLLPGSSRASFAVSLVLGLLLSTAYLRSRALWVSWGVNFGWKASRALLFGLAVSGIGSHSSVVEGDPMGPFWLTGGGFGLDGTWIAFLVILAAIPVMFRLTRDLDYRYNAPVLEPGGIPVDLDAAARARHEAAMGPAAPPLVQIIGPAKGPVVNGPGNGPVGGPASVPASGPGSASGSPGAGETPVDPPTTS
jgi:membrane protease YdiL (CAAX protease family)